MKLALIGRGGRPELALATGPDGAERLLPLIAAQGLPGVELAAGFLSGDDPLRNLLEAGDEGQAFLAQVADAVAGAATGDPRLAAMTLDAAAVRFLPPVLRPGKILAAGRNYRRPGQPASAPDQPGPPIFAKFPTTLVGHGQPVRYPAETRNLDYEAELAIIIGRPCRGVRPAEAMRHVAGFTVFNDLTMSDVQRREMEGGLMLFGKNADDTGPCGPWMVTPEALGDPDALRIGLRVNGETRQDDSTASMIFGIRQLVAYCSRMTLMPGDIIATGTPAGIAAQRPEPEAFFLKPGDVVEAWVEGIGTLRNPVIAQP